MIEEKPELELLQNNPAFSIPVDTILNSEGIYKGILQHNFYSSEKVVENSCIQN